MPATLPFLAIVGYGLAALAYLGLAGLIVISWRQRPQGRLLLLAAGVSALWAGAALLTTWPGFPSALALASEIARNGAWLALLFYILQLRLPQAASLPAPLRVIRLLAGLLVPGLFGLSMYAVFVPLPPLLAHWTGTLGPVLLAVTGLVLVEQVYRSTRLEDRWAIKFLCLGLGALFVYDFYLYAHAALFGAMDAQVWTARGYIAALVTPLIAVSAARNPDWSAPLGLSRSMAFHTASLLGAGSYLLLIAGAGYYLRLFGGEWGDVMLTVFVFAAAMLLVLLMFSGTLRARLRVFLSKHFFSYRYDYREEWLNFTRTLTEGRPGVQLGERAVEALARLLESPGGALWMHEGASYQRDSHWNWGDVQGSEPADSVFIQWLAGKQWVVDLDEMKTHRDLYGELDAPGWIRHADDAWLVVPLMLHEELLGFVILKHSLGKVSFNWEVSDLLKVAARQAAAHLSQMRASNQLIVARQFESFNRTTTFVIHDLKNLVAQLSLLLANAEKHQHNPEFQADMLDTVDNAVTRMNKVLAQLRRGGDEARPQSVELADILDDAITSKQAFKLRPVLELPETPLRVRAERERLTRAVGHMLQNALEATPPTGEVILRAAAGVSEKSGMAIIDIIDTGSGMDDEFIRSRLFQPFDSTKGAGMGIGAYECRETLRALGGNIEVASTPGRGTHFRLSLPLDTHESEQGDAA
jgi:putative PEP-CTERM system histidine kinase